MEDRERKFPWLVILLALSRQCCGADEVQPATQSGIDAAAAPSATESAEHMQHFDIPAGPLGESLITLQQQATECGPLSCELSPAQADAEAPAVRGDMFFNDALHQLLAGSLSLVQTDGNLCVFLCPRSAEFKIDAGNASETIGEFSLQAHMQVLFDFNVVKGVRTESVRGLLTPSDALAIMLKGTGLKFDHVNARTVAITQEPVTLAPTGRRWLKSRPSPPELRRSGPLPLEQVVVSSVSLNDVSLSVGGPQTTLSRLEIDSTGAATVPDLVRTLPQVFGGGPTDHTFLGREAATNSSAGTGFNLRGLDAGATLVLINGRRLAGSGTAAEYADVSNFPLSAIDRVTIAADGSSPRYGSDAVAGVVNFETRKDFVGSETEADGGEATGGALGQSRFSQLLGTKWSSGHAMLSAEYYRRDALAADARSQATNDLLPFGGDNFSQPYGAPGTIMVGPQTWAIPALHGAPLSASALQPGTVNLYDQYRNTDILPSERRWTFTANVGQLIGDGAEVWLDTWVSDGRKDIAQQANSATLMVPSSNPFYINPTGGTGPVQVLYGFGNVLGPIQYDGRTLSSSSAVGARIEMGAWKLSGYLGYASEDLRQSISNAVSYVALASALASSSPLTAFNPFGDGSNTNPAVLKALRTTRSYHSHSDLMTVNIGGDRSLLDMAAGPIRLALGSEARREHLSSFTGTDGLGVPPVSEAFGRTVTAAFTQLDIPLTGKRTSEGWNTHLAASLGARYEHYEALGSALTPRAGVSWMLTPRFLLRGTWARAVRPPAMTDFDETRNESGLVTLADKQSPNGTTVLYWYGGNANLRLERSDTWTLGVDLKPMESMSLGLTYFDITDRGRIDQFFLTTDALRDTAFLGSIIRNFTPAQRAEVCARSTFFGVNPGDCLNAPIGALIDLRSQNLDTLETRGFDITGRYTAESLLGRFRFGLDATYLLAFSQAKGSGVAPLDLLNTEHNPINWRVRGMLAWDWGPVGATTFVNFTNRYEDTASVPNRSVAPWTTLDLNVQYHPGHAAWLDGTVVALSIQNLLNTQAPFVNNGAVGLGYDQENASLAGRVIGVRLRHEW